MLETLVLPLFLSQVRYQTGRRPRVPPLREQKGQDHFGGDAAGKSSTLIRTNELRGQGFAALGQQASRGFLCHPQLDHSRWLVGPAGIGDGSSTDSKPASSFGQTIADGRLSVSQLQLQTKPKRSRASDSCLSQTWNIDAAALLLCTAPRFRVAESESRLLSTISVQESEKTPAIES